MPASYSLFELNEYIRRVIALNFAEPIWVNCEISQVKEVRGNVYLDLIYQDETTGDITAQIGANIWYKSHLFIKNKLGDLLPAILKEGSHVLLKVNVEFNERYGMKLVIEDIDPSYTIGQMEMQRQKIIQKLTDDGLLDRNKETRLPSVIKRIAIISSETAAGFIDFRQHIIQNNYGYTFDMDLYQIALQGANTERDFTKAILAIEERSKDYDCILVIRGGGSKLDLAAFDHYNIGAKIGKSKIPVITGIGHDIDSTIADVCAYESCKTPTAVADFIIEHNYTFEAKVLESMYWIAQTAKQHIRHAELSLNQSIQLLHILPNDIIRTQYDLIDQGIDTALLHIRHRLSKASDSLTFADKQMKMLDPRFVLKRGYAIIRQEEKIITRAKHFNKNQPSTIEFFDKIIPTT
jgi:exodeoxyribonuclease VII large subunit